MKHTAPLVIFLAILSCISGYLMSKASWIGRVGMTFFYREYNFLKTWWQGALAVFGTLIILLIVQGIVQKNAARRTANVVHVVAIVLSLAGLYYTYSDFRHTLSHRLLKERFHLGVYLFWIGWLIISLFYLWNKRVGKTGIYPNRI